MKKVLNAIAAPLFLSLVLLASCSGGESSSVDSSSSQGEQPVVDYTSIDESHASITISNDNHSQGQIFTPEETFISETYNSLEEVKHYNTQSLPSSGDVNLLVVPVLIPGYEEIDIDDDGVSDNDRVLEDLNTVFFGEAEDTAWQSVSSYYEQASYGKLNLSGTVTDWFDLSEVGYEDYDIDVSDTLEVARYAVDWVKESTDLKITDYDSDRDGYIDGLWLIYSAPDYKNGGPVTDNNNYWAYTTWGNQTTDDDGEAANVNNPVYNLYGWGSYDFMYEGYGISSLDAHTYIHETGHFLGYSDYYSDNSSYNPIGKIDMMDGNVIDLNSYSKMLVGWTNPYIVCGNGTIDLSCMENVDACIVIPPDDYVYDPEVGFDPFSEYIVIELYNNTGLNYFDSLEAYSDISPRAMSTIGVRIYHVNNSKYIINTEDTSNIQAELYTDQIIDAYNRIIIPITNNTAYNIYNTTFGLPISCNLWDEIRMIEAGGTDTFSSGGYQKSGSLFKAGSSFSLAEYGEQFFDQGTTLDNGGALSCTVSIDSIEEAN